MGVGGGYKALNRTVVGSNVCDRLRARRNFERPGTPRGHPGAPQGSTPGRVPLRTGASPYGRSRETLGGQRDPLRRFLRNEGRFQKSVKSGHFKAS